MHAFISINKNKLLQNISTLKSLLPERYKFIAVIKGNAYGHGLEEIVSIIDEHVDGYHVDDAIELTALRKKSSKLALVLGYVDNDSLEGAMKLGCTLSVFNREQISRINDIAARLGIVQSIHIKIDALTGRMGFFVHELSEILTIVKQQSNIRITGVYSHLTGLKDTINTEHTRKQLALFREGYAKFAEYFPDSKLDAHISSSAGIFIDEIINDPIFTMIRIGKAMYGIWPSKGLPQTVVLNQILEWKTQVAQVKTFPADYPIGYHATTKTQGEIIAAVVPQGYSDGYDKKMSEKGSVIISGEKCKILGKVAMSMLLVDISSCTNIKQGDEVVLIGTQKETTLSIDEVGEAMGATSCEILSKISPLLPRIVI